MFPVTIWPSIRVSAPDLGADVALGLRTVGDDRARQDMRDERVFAIGPGNLRGVVLVHPLKARRRDRDDPGLIEIQLGRRRDDR